MFKADFIQHLNLGSSPMGNCLFTLAIPHFFESLSDTVLRVLPSLVVANRNVVNVQMGSRLVHVQDSVKNVKVGITTLETFHILFQAVGNELKILGAVPRIFFFADLNYVLIKALSFVGGSYDMKNVLAAISDGGNYFELSENYAPEAVCALASVGGTVSGIVANQPKENGGRLTPNAARKIAKFVSMCDAFGIPVVTLVDSEGVTAGDDYENAPYAAELAKLAYAYSAAETAKITVVLGSAYGSAFVLMGSKSIGADVAFALDTAKISILSPKAAVAFLENEKVAKRSRDELEAEWAAENAAPVKAAVHGEIDDVIAASELRMRICAALSMLASKCGGAPARKHANLPL